MQVDFWDPEPGYYLNGTFYGDKNILAIGGAGQVQGSDKSAYSVDFLLERKVGGGGAVSVEAEWAKYDRLGGYNAQLRHRRRRLRARRAICFRPWSASGGSRSSASTRTRGSARASPPLDADYDQKTTELNLNYVIKQFNARVMIFFKDTRFDAVRTDFMQVGVGLQMQM